MPSYPRPRAPSSPTLHPPQASDVLRQLLDPASKQGAALRKPLPGGRAPSLPDLFSIGQFVRCTVIGLGGGGDGDGDADGGGGKKGQVRLSLRLKRLCDGAGPGALAAGRCVPAVVRSAEDHVYTLTFGVKVRPPRPHRGRCTVQGLQRTTPQLVAPCLTLHRS
jgi:hypothetical protein